MNELDGLSPMVTKRRQLLLALNEVDRSLVEDVGHKAANLGELRQAGFPVPEGYVLTTLAFEKFLEHNSLTPTNSEEQAERATLPNVVARALDTCIKSLGIVPVAVRSSGIGEDTSEMSYAGQYETVLNVVGMEALANAVKRCWASSFSNRIRRYEEAMGRFTTKRVGVLIQHMVSSDAAGVAFSINPVSGKKDEVVIEAIRGLGDRLVRGEVTPDQWIVRGEDAMPNVIEYGAIDKGQALSIASLVRLIEKYFGAAQDIEWAIGNGKLFVLQARPITSKSTES